MKYIIYKANTYLVDLSEWSQTWLTNAAKAIPFRDREEAERVAGELDATVLTLADYSVN